MSLVAASSITVRSGTGWVARSRTMAISCRVPAAGVQPPVWLAVRSLSLITSTAIFLVLPNTLRLQPRDLNDAQSYRLPPVGSLYWTSIHSSLSLNGATQSGKSGTTWRAPGKHRHIFSRVVVGVHRIASMDSNMCDISVRVG